MNCQVFHAVECQLPSKAEFTASNHTFSCSLWHKSREKKIALISFLTAAEWAPLSCEFPKWSVAVIHGSLVLLLNERGCGWWLTWLVVSVLFWSDRKAALNLLGIFHCALSTFARSTKSIKAFISILHKDFFFPRCYQMWLFSKWNQKTECGYAIQESTNNIKICKPVISYRHVNARNTAINGRALECVF